MKGAQVTVKTRAKNKRAKVAVTPPPEKVQDKLEDPLESLGLEDASASSLTSSEEGSPESARQSAVQARGAESPLVDTLQPLELHDPLQRTEKEDAALMQWLSQGTEAQGEAQELPSAPPEPAGLAALDQAMQGLGMEQESAPEVDPAQAAKAVLALRILDQLAGSLGLGQVTLRSDSEAQARLAALGTKGLMEGGEVLIDPNYLDPDSAEGRRLLAHEAVHAAQDRLPAANALGEDAGFRAEREAQVLSRQFASSGQMQQPVFGLPAGHVAADGDVMGKGLGPLISGYRGDVDSFQSGLGPQVGPKGNSGKKNSKEDRATKVGRYADGVDGIADQIGDLDAFADLCDTIEDGPKEYMKHMRRIERTSVFGRLAEMWQGAKDGGLDAPAMKKAFNYEFNGRGFWAETEKAFDLVQKRAKEEAKRRADADKAAKARDKALSSSADKADLATSGGEAGAAGKLPLQQRAKIDPKLAKLMNATVTEAAPALPGLEAFTAMPEATLLSIEAENNHAAEFTASHGPMSLENSRLGLVLEEYKGSVGNFASGFVDGMVDGQTSKLGALGDKGLGKVLPGMSGLTTVMPAVSVVSGFQKTFSTEEWAGKGSKLSKSWGAQADKYAALDNSELSGTDRIGLWISLIADWMDMANVVISTASEILSFIQDLLYVLGAIFFAVGLALIWLPVGLPMVNAGIWMLETAQALQPAVKLLGMISYVLAGVVMGFRTAAVFMVPAEFLAAETEALGLSADSFATKSGSKVATKTNKLIKSNKEKKAAEQKAAEEEAANQIKSEGPKNTLSGTGTEQSLQDKMKQTTMDAQDKVSETLDKSKDKAAQKKDEGNTQSGATVPVFDVNKDGVTNVMKNTNKMELGEVKTAKDGRIYTYATNKKGDKQLLWGTKGGDPSELEAKLDKYNTGTTWWQKQKNKVNNAQYSPDKLKNKQLFSLLKTAQTVTAWAVGGAAQQTLAEAVPTLGKLEGSMPDFFRKANLVVPLIDKNSGVAQVAAVRKDLVSVSSTLSSLFSELGAAATSGKFGEDELAVAVGVVQGWERGIRLLAKQIEAAASGDEVPRELPDSGLKRNELKDEIAALQTELDDLEGPESFHVPAVASTTAVSLPKPIGPTSGQDDQARISELRAQLSDKRAELDSLGDPKGNKAPIQAKTDAIQPAKALAAALFAVLPDFAPFKGLKVPADGLPGLGHGLRL